MLEIHQPDDTYTAEQARQAKPKALMQYLAGILQNGIAFLTAQNGDSITNMLNALQQGGFDAIAKACDCAGCSYKRAYIEAAAPLFIEAIAKAKAMAAGIRPLEDRLREKGKVKQAALRVLDNECQQLARKGALS